MVREGSAGTVGLKARDSPRETQHRDRRDWKTHLIFILCCAVCPWCGQSQGGAINSQIHKEASITYMNRLNGIGVRRKRKSSVNFIFFLLVSSFAYMCRDAVKVTLLTSDLPNGAKNIQFFRVQRFNVVIDIPVNDEGKSQQHKQCRN